LIGSAVNGSKGSCFWNVHDPDQLMLMTQQILM
jgi:hypothetical protein